MEETCSAAILEHTHPVESSGRVRILLMPVCVPEAVLRSATVLEGTCITWLHVVTRGTTTILCRLTCFYEHGKHLFQFTLKSHELLSPIIG